MPHELDIEQLSIAACVTGLAAITERGFTLETVPQVFVLAEFNKRTGTAADANGTSLVSQ
ncbi:MAG: hypothetical protein WCE61_12760 [Candidatus Acidiferrum sp.]